MLSRLFAVFIVFVLLASSWIEGFVSRGPKSKNGHFNTARKMFSGIVEAIGRVDSVSKTEKTKQWDGSAAEGVALTVSAPKALEDAYIGCSIAVNGVCLTATALGDSKFTVGVSPETIRRTNLGLLREGSPVNVERALKADGRNSGHFVQGHVDGTGRIAKKWQEGDSLWFRIEVDSITVSKVTTEDGVEDALTSSPQDLLRYIVPKGFVCVDGTSLTVCEVHRPTGPRDKGWFTLMMVSHTQQHVILPMKQVGELVNIEVDVVGKLVEQSVANRLKDIESKLDALVTDNARLKDKLRHVAGSTDYDNQ